MFIVEKFKITTRTLESHFYELNTSRMLLKVPALRYPDSRGCQCPSSHKKQALVLFAKILTIQR